ncbi:hypothetical protein Cni_G17945 [Canna indica]|uniref:Uncharacterized protein n=1 Tax=Canna indica TaxID=4628 RepID=A0AAQ3KIB8_9LILI|nr:hypothetical protein Cni_G17945 [Canna indica]
MQETQIQRDKVSAIDNLNDLLKENKIPRREYTRTAKTVDIREIPNGGLSLVYWYSLGLWYFPNRKLRTKITAIRGQISGQQNDAPHPLELSSH